MIFQCDLLEENEYDSLSEEAESIMDQQGYGQYLDPA